MNRWAYGILAFFAVMFALSQQSAYAKGGGHSIGGGLAFISPSQDDLNGWMNSLAIAGTKEMGSGYELFFTYEYRFSSSIFAIMARPSYYTQTASGSGVESNLSGITLFPMLRLYPLENNLIKFFMQVGIGYGTANLKLSNSNVGGSGSYSAGEFGALEGLGASFCFGSHCFSLEGNGRYLPMRRVTGTGSTLGGTITQATGELETNNTDLGITLSGFSGTLSYLFNF